MLLSVGGVLAASFGVALGALLISHCWLLVNNLTSIEVGFEGRNPYALGPAQNAQQVLGSLDLAWLLPVAPARPLSDGLSFPLHDCAVLGRSTGSRAIEAC